MAAILRMALAVVLCSILFASASVARAKEVQRTRDADRWLVAKHQSGEDWLVTYDASRGTVSGSVVQADGTPVLIDCDVIEILAEEFLLECHAAGENGWEYLQTTELWRGFLGWPEEPAVIHEPRPDRVPAAPRPTPTSMPTPIPTSPPAAVARVWIAGLDQEGAFVARLEEGDDTWVMLETFPGQGEIELEFVSPSVGWLTVGLPGEPTQLWRTNDGGDTWTEGTASLPEPTVVGLGARRIDAVAFADERRGFVASHFVLDEGVYADLVVTKDGGESWVPADLGLSEPQRSFAFSRACMMPDGAAFTTFDPVPLFLGPPPQGDSGQMSSDFGATWTFSGARVTCGDQSSYWWSLTLSGQTDYYYSESARADPQELSIPSRFRTIVLQAAHGEDHAWAWARSCFGCSGTELIVTSDRGQSWRELAVPLGADGQMFEVAAIDERTLLLSVGRDFSAEAIVRSDDGGNTWQDLPQVPDLVEIQSLAAQRLPD